MTVCQAVRLSRAFNNDILNMKVGAGLKKQASTLLRIVALTALTHNEEKNPGLAEHLKLHPILDTLLPFSPNIYPNRVNDNIDLQIARNELPGVEGKNALDFSNFMQLDVAGKNAAAAANGGQWPDAFVNAVVAAVPPTSQIIFDNYNDAINQNIFLNEVNGAHNVQKQVGMINLPTLIYTTQPTHQDDTNNFFIAPMVSSMSNSGPSTSIGIRYSGSLEGAVVGSWGAYNGNTRETNAFNNLRDYFRGFNAGAPVDLTSDGRLLKDLYRLECVRDPVTLLTNAMFLDLANQNYNSINGVINYQSIEANMPMAADGAVAASRSLWRHVTNIHQNLYYKYDHTALSGIGAEGYNAHANRENNILFHWLIMLSGFTDELNNIINLGDDDSEAQVDECINNLNWNIVNDTTLNKTSNNNITIQIIVPQIGAIRADDLIITHFPLALLNHLILEWYDVNLGIPNVNAPDGNGGSAAQNGDIQIDLRLIP